jgi:hypothetical protein
MKIEAMRGPVAAGDICEADKQMELFSTENAHHFLAEALVFVSREKMSVKGFYFGAELRAGRGHH